MHRLMGLSAFAGFPILLAGWPLNSYLAKRSIRINKGTLAARDKRMGVLDELIKAVRVHAPIPLVLLWLMLLVRSNSSNSSHGRTDGFNGLWMLGKMR